MVENLLVNISVTLFREPGDNFPHRPGKFLPQVCLAAEALFLDLKNIQPVLVYRPRPLKTKDKNRGADGFFKTRYGERSRVQRGPEELGHDHAIGNIWRRVPHPANVSEQELLDFFKKCRNPFVIRSRNPTWEHIWPVRWLSGCRNPFVIRSRNPTL